MMTIKQIYELAIKLGTQNDLRGVAAVKRKLKRENEKYEKLSAEEKKTYDKENLTNPYSDTRYFAKDPDQQIKRLLVGIDLDTEEVLLAKELTDGGKPIDLVMSHHPIGIALAGLHEVMHLQAEVMALHGVPINIAESLMQIRVSEVSRSIDPYNHQRVIDSANLLGFPLMCVHTASDNMVATFLKNLIDRHQKNIETVGDIMKLFDDIPEYQIATKLKSGPVLYAGSEDRYAGKIAVTEVTGGTEGSKEMYGRLAQAGIGTIIGMHMKEDHKKEAEKHHINVIVVGHMSSDSLGMNLFLDELEKKGIEIIPCSGLIRVSRIKKSKKITIKRKKRR